MIKIIFDKYANTTDGLSKVSRYLFSLGYKSRTGKRIDTTILTRIIENPKYKIRHLGKSVAGELLGWGRPDITHLRNESTNRALRCLGFDIKLS